jgi:hypothetical protein
MTAIVSELAGGLATAGGYLEGLRRGNLRSRREPTRLCDRYREAADECEASDQPGKQRRVEGLEPLSRQSPTAFSAFCGVVTYRGKNRPAQNRWIAVQRRDDGCELEEIEASLPGFKGRNKRLRLLQSLGQLDLTKFGTAA